MQITLKVLFKTIVIVGLTMTSFHMAMAGSPCRNASDWCDSENESTDESMLSSECEAGDESCINDTNTVDSTEIDSTTKDVELE